jgi:D-glycero-alpha-D-manno-heptose 1-phosphate guanylyltransferase
MLPLTNTDVAILVGGMGTRLRMVVDDVPKPLAPVLGRPFLFYLLDMLALRGARSVTLCCGYKADLVRKMTGTSWLGMALHQSVETEPLGTAGALALAASSLTSPHVLVMNGDSWLEPEWSHFLHIDDDLQNDGYLALVGVADASRFGTVGMDGEKITLFHEKSEGQHPGLINGGVYLISQKILNALPVRNHSLEREVFPELVAGGRLAGSVTTSPFLDIGVPDAYHLAGGFVSALGIAPHKMFPDSAPMEMAVPELGTCAIIFNEAGKVLMERRSDCGWWGLPGGRLVAGESVSQGAVREARDRTGLDIEITDFLGVFSDPRRRTVRYPDNGNLRHLVDSAVLARPTGGALSASPESIGVEWFAPKSLPLNTVPPVVEILRSALLECSHPVMR